MKIPVRIIMLFILISTGSCISQFVPVTDEAKSFLVVEGLLTDQNNAYKVKISRSSSPGSKKPGPVVTGCVVYVSDDQNNKYIFNEKPAGTYKSDSLLFRGVAGRKYVLHITSDAKSYETFPIEMKPVPLMDSLFAEIVYKNTYILGDPVPGYQVYINSYDPTGKCNYYRWDFTETWQFRLPYTYETVKNRICWKTAVSTNIYVKNTSSLKEARVARFPLNFITTETDRLTIKYSMLLRQFSLNQDEFDYWEKLQRLTEESGGLYDIVPMSVGSNIHCVDFPEEKVLGYFSVSSVSVKRLFITNTLRGFPDFYKGCPVDTVRADRPVPGLNQFVYIIEKIYSGSPSPDLFVLTDKKACVDCTVTGSVVMPPFWNDTKGDVVILNTLK
jgi:hypothetical protein